MRDRHLWAALVSAALLVAACDGGMGPSGSSPRVTSISPNQGTTLGGNTVTIAGANFSAGATVTLGGSPATNVVVVGPATITASPGQHAAGTVDVVVTVNGRSGSLSKGYSYVAPQQTVNTPPQITSISAKGSKPREPEKFADLDERLNVSAAVSDAESPVSALKFAWSAQAGSFEGTGTSVIWIAPHQFSTPASVVLSLTVTETYATTDDQGLPVNRENTATATTTVRVHNSVKEVGDLATDFLIAFSRQLDPNDVMRNFTPSCSGTADERGDVVKNQRDYTITAYTIGAPATSVEFTGTCSFRTRFGDACARVPVSWTNTIKATGDSGTVTGFDQVTAILENDQWRLCGSEWDQRTSTFRYPFRFKR